MSEGSVHFEGHAPSKVASHSDDRAKSAPPQRHAVRLRSIVFSYRTAHTPIAVLGGVSTEFACSSISSVVGPSGCGKTTLLNLVAGLLEPDEGAVERTFGGHRCGYVFQAPSLVPWLRVAENALLGAEISGVQSEAVMHRCDMLLRRFGLKGFERAYPAALSGGMQQRVSIIRAALSGAKVLLLDEPFSNSDFLFRLELQREVSRLVEEENLAAVLVTHDIEDAVRVSDKVIVLTNRPAKVKGELSITVPRSQRLSDDPSSVRLIAPYLEHIWKLLKSADVPKNPVDGALA